MKGLRVGFARCDVTPHSGLPLDGFAGRDDPAVETLDPLFARVLVATTDEAQLCIVGLDALGAGAALVSRIRRTLVRTLGVRRDHVVVAASHTHAAPVGMATPSTHEGAHRYLDWLVLRVAATADAARAAARPSRVRYGESPTAGIASNRIDPSAPVDSVVRVLEFSSAREGAPIGGVAHFACHPTVLGETNLGYSGDFVGSALSGVEQATGVPCLFLQGAAADVSTRFTRRERTHAEAMRLGHLLADAIAHAGGAAVEAVPGLAVVHRYVDLPTRALPPRDELARLIGMARAELAALPAEDRELGVGRRLQARLVGALAWKDMAEAGGPASTIRATLTGVRLAGPLLATVPGELFHGTAAGTAGYGTTWLPVTLAGGYHGYFPTLASVATQEYESLNTVFDAEATGRIMRVLTRLVTGLSSRTRLSQAEAP